jgi:hypothetical protein
VRDNENGITPGLLLAILNTRVVRRQIRNKRLTRDVIDTLGHRLLEVVLPIPNRARDRANVSDAMTRLLVERDRLRRIARQLGEDAEAA